MPGIDDKRCALHHDREAVAMCLACGRFFCRECITEHENRVLCSQCLSQLKKKRKTAGSRVFAKFGGLLQIVCAVMLLWMLFYYMGQHLISAPSLFHEKTQTKFRLDR